MEHFPQNTQAGISRKREDIIFLAENSNFASGEHEFRGGGIV